MKINSTQSIDLSSDEGIIVILDLLIENRAFRRSFFANPDKALEKMSIYLPSRERDRLVKRVWKKLAQTDASFDEQFLLCCSPD